MKFVSQKFPIKATRNRRPRETKIVIPRSKIRCLRISHKTHKKSTLPTNQRHCPTKLNSFLTIFPQDPQEKFVIPQNVLRFPQISQRIDKNDSFTSDEVCFVGYWFLFVGNVEIF